MPKDLAGKTVLITGANTGIGQATAVSLAKRGARLFLAGRSRERTEETLALVRELGAEVEFMALDLGDLDSVRACAEAYLAKDLPLDVLIANAGLAGQKGMTKSGFELTFGVNHVGHYLFCRLLVDACRAAVEVRGSARIVIVSSRAHYKVDAVAYDSIRKPTATPTGLPEYQSSKLANVLFADALGRRLKGSGITTYSLHPGVIASSIWRSVPWPIRPILTFFMDSNEDGAKTSVYCATSPECADETGRYYDSEKRRDWNAAITEEMAEELWNRTAEWVGLPA